MRGQNADAFRFMRPDWRHFVKPGSDAWVLYELYERKFNPEQSRVPAGSREGGQWVGEVGASPPNTGSDTGTESGRISTKIAYDCDFMHRQDLFICKAVQSAVCYAQAYLRYTNCQNGRPIPPLNF